MKAIKRILWAFVAGEAMMLWKKDASFKKWIEEKESIVDKVTFAFKKLFDFNQELFIDTKETLKRLDIETELDKAKTLVNNEAITLKWFLTTKSKEVEWMSKAKADEVVTEAEKRYNALYTYVHGYANDMIKKYHLEEKLEEVKETYDVLKNKVEDIKKA